MSKKVLPILALLFAMAATLNAQDQYLIEIQAGKKVLHVSELKLPETTTLGEILSHFPELLSRSAKIENYDLQIDDVSTEASAEAMLENLRLCDIKDIEVSTSPGTSQQKNGQGGVINVIPRKLDDGTSGRASLVAGTLLSVNPGVIVNYHKDKLDFRANAILNYTDPYKNVEDTYQQKGGIFEGYSLDTCRNRSGYELVNLYAKYTFNENTKLKGWLRESFSASQADHNIGAKENGVLSHKTKDNAERNFNLYGGANFETKNDKWLLEAQVEYSYNPQLTKIYAITEQSSTATSDFTDDYCERSLKAYVKGKYFVVPTTPQQKCEIVAGVNSNYNPSVYEYRYKGKQGPLQGTDPATRDLDAQGHALYLSPFIECNSIFGPCFLKAGVRFQHNRFNVDVTTDAEGPASGNMNDWTSFINFGYQIAPHHHISMILDRSIRRPTTTQLYPHTIYDPLQQSYAFGNKDLKSASIHKASIAYITDHSFDKGGDLSFDIGLEYINAQRLINPVNSHGFITYANNGANNIANFNLSTIYSRGVFSVALAGNVFQNWAVVSGVNDSYFYYNISISPMLQFNDGWGISARFTYNSRILTKQSVLNDYFYSTVRFNKILNKLTFFLELADNFHDYAEDKIFGTDATTLHYYNLHRASLNLGVSYRF